MVARHRGERDTRQIFHFCHCTRCDGVALVVSDGFACRQKAVGCATHRSTYGRHQGSERGHASFHGDCFVSGDVGFGEFHGTKTAGIALRYKRGEKPP